MESQPQNPEFRINPENFHPLDQPVHLSAQSYQHLCMLSEKNNS